MKVDLDDIERRARAATLGPWRTESTRGDRWHVAAPGGFPVGRDPDGGPASFDSHTASHIAANSPPVTTALVARIRELEAQALRTIEATGLTVDDELEVLRKLIEKGAVIA
jgi:hypothetical protein